MANKLIAIDCVFFDDLDAIGLCETLINIRKAQKNTEVLYIYGITRTEWPTLSVEQRKYIRFREILCKWQL